MRYLFFLTVFLLTSCFANGLGGGPTIEMKCSRIQLFKSLNEFILNEEEYKLPSKMKKLNIWTEKELDESMAVIINLKGDLIFASLIKKNLNDSNSTNPSYVSIRYIYSEADKNWFRTRRYSDSYVKNLTSKLDSLILRKLNCN